MCIGCVGGLILALGALGTFSAFLLAVVGTGVGRGVGIAALPLVQAGVNLVEDFLLLTGDSYS